MRTFIVILVFVISFLFANAQTTPDWNTSGNGLLPGYFLGSINNQSLKIRTTNIERMRINANTGINAAYLGNPGLFAFSTANYPAYLPMNANGYVGIRTGSPRAMLHIRGPEGIFGSGTGWRPWMKTGVFMNEQSNNMYVGMYHRDSTGSIRPDAVVNWGDDNINSSTPTKLRFIFTPSVGVLGTGVVPAQNRDQEMMSIWPDRNAGIGDFINFTTGPQSHLHIHNAFDNRDYLQITTNNTGHTAADGVRLGMVGANRETHVQQQENSHIRIFTNSPGITLNERMRITHIGAPGVIPNPPSGSSLVTNNSTRIGIPVNPNDPITNPLSLLHLGREAVIGGNAILAGWRPWMQNGMLVTQNTDHVFIGLKPELSLSVDRWDAVIGWGDNAPPGVDNSGPDNLRFIFSAIDLSSTTNTNGVTGFNGQEVARFTPNCINCPINKPSFGIGDFAPSSTQFPSSAGYVGATLDVDGDARIRSVQQNETLNQVLVRDPNDYGRVYWRDANNFTGAAINANNGCSTDPLNANTVQFGQNINATGNPAQLLNYREVPMNNQNIYFLGQNPTTQGLNAIGIGFPNNVTNLPAKLSVWEDPGQPVAFNTVGVLGRNSSASPALNGPFNYIGVAGVADGEDLPENKNIHIGGYFSSDGGVVNYGVMGLANTGNASNDNINYGGFFQAIANSNISNNVGVYGTASNGQQPRGGFFGGFAGNNTTTGVEGNAGGLSSSSIYYAGKFTSNATTGSTQYGIYAEAPIDSGNSFAGWFEGDVHVTGTFTNPSDASIKTNVQTLNNVSQQLQQLHPVSFQYTNAAVPQLNLSAGNHYGLIAQQVEQVFPELVQNTQVAPVYDSLGQVVHPAATVKSVNYVEIIPLLIGAFHEQQQKIAQQDSLLQALQQQMQLLAGMITNCCQAAQPMQIQNNNPGLPSIQHEYTMEVRLRNEDMIVLNQNAPNPFKEQTTITWYLPERVQRAQLVFTNNLGQVIKMVDIRENGQGRLVVYAEDLSSGMYNYSLIVDGQIVETKRMTKVD